MISLLLAVALSQAAPSPVLRQEVEAVLGRPDLAYAADPPWRAGSTVLVYVTSGQARWPRAAAAPPGRWMLVVLVGPDGAVQVARSVPVTPEDAPPLDATEAVLAWVRNRRS